MWSVVIKSGDKAREFTMAALSCFEATMVAQLMAEEVFTRDEMARADIVSAQRVKNL